MTPDAIRELLAGITAGEWVVKPTVHVGHDIVSDPIGGRHGLVPLVSTALRPSDAAFIAASPGIARYALELAAENERLKTALEAIQREYSGQKAADIAMNALAALTEECRYVAHGDPARVCRKGKGHDGYCDAVTDEEHQALAPQPAPTGGVELNP